MIDSNNSFTRLDGERAGATPNQTVQALQDNTPTLPPERLGSKQERSTQPQAKKFVLSDFETIRLLGKGSFGEVSLVKHVRSGDLYALKQIQKEKIRGSKHI